MEKAATKNICRFGVFRSFSDDSSTPGLATQVETREHVDGDRFLPRCTKATVMIRNMETWESMVLMAAVWQATGVAAAIDGENAHAVP